MKLTYIQICYFWVLNADKNKWAGGESLPWNYFDSFKKQLLKINPSS